MSQIMALLPIKSLHLIYSFLSILAYFRSHPIRPLLPYQWQRPYWPLIKPTWWERRMPRPTFPSRNLAIVITRLGGAFSCPPHDSRFRRIHGGKHLHPSFRACTTLQSWLDLSSNNPVRSSCHLSFAFCSCHKSAHQVDTKCNRTMYIVPFLIGRLDLPQWNSRSWLSYGSF